MPTRTVEHAAPPDAAGNAGSFTRTEPMVVEATEHDLPGAPWESPRKGEKSVRADKGLLFTIVLAVIGAGVVLVYCAAPHL